MDPGTLTIIGMVMGGIGSVVQGVQGANAASASQAQYEDQQRQVEISALEQERARREQLNIAQASQDAAGAAGGIDITRSASFTALQNYDKNALAREIMLIRTGADSSKYRLGLAAQGAQSAGTASMVGGLFSFGRSIFGAYDASQQLKIPTGYSGNGRLAGPV